MGETVEPQGLAAALLVVTIIFTVVCVVVVGLRVYFRVTSHQFGLEDWLMSIGLVINLVHNGIAIWGTFVGIGTPDSRLAGNVTVQLEGAKAVIFWQVFYVTSSSFIKSSICATLIRISVKRRYTYTLYVLIVLAVTANLVAFVAVLARCSPVAAAWDPAAGSCTNQRVLVPLTYAVSAINIATDWCTALLPMLMLRNVQMKPDAKRYTALVLGLGVLASVATIIRMPYSTVYSETSNVLYGMGDIILWTVVECDIGIIAGSLPMLRKLIRSLDPDQQSGDHEPQELTLLTVGRIKKRQRPVHDTDILASVAHGGDDVESGADDSSTREIFKVEHISSNEKAAESGMGERRPNRGQARGQH